jgi:hypothetical protein
MTELARFATFAIVMGAAGAALMDVWALILRRGWGIPTLDYALLGRWLGHMPKGRFVHDRIAVAAPVRGERVLGWVAHYAIGVAFAIPVLLLGGGPWLEHPSLVPAMAVAVASVVAPWFVMQPAMGAGIAGSRTPNPRATRLRNLGTHIVYGIGLYGSALALSML